MTGKPRLTYREAGVDIEASERALGDVSDEIRASFTPGVLGDIGLFGGLYHLGAAGFRDPILVSSADGVGTKLDVAKRMGVHDSVGRDLVQHCINDILVQGARPLFFFDYAAMGELEPAVIADLVRGCARACRDNGLALLGGETAEMPGLYSAGDFELVGFIVGAVERELLIDGGRVAAGQVLVGLGSSGLHTNGYSLARRILFDRLELGVDDRPEELGGASVGEALLAEHRSYLSCLMPFIEERKLAGMAHITGGGLPGNLARLLRGVDAHVDTSAWEPPALFRMLVEGGDLERSEAFKAFNMGIGMVLFLDPEDVNDVRSRLDEMGEPSVVLGELKAGEGRVILE